MNIKHLLSISLLFSATSLAGCDAPEGASDDEFGPQVGGKADSIDEDGPGKDEDDQGEDEDDQGEDEGDQGEETAEINAAIVSALDGATPLRIEHYCNNGDNDVVPQGDARIPVGCRTVTFFQDADGVPLLDNDDPTDDIIMDGFWSGERQVCATAWFYRNGRVLDGGLPSWTIARDSTCDGTDNITLEEISPENLDVELTFDNDDNDIPFTIPGLTVVELNADGSTTARMSSFHFTDDEVSLQLFEGTDETDLELTLDRHYWHAELDMLP